MVQCGSAVTEIHLPDSVTHVGEGAFSYCGSLTNVDFGDGVTSVGSGAFDFCNALQSLHFMGNAPRLDDAIIEAPPTVYYLPGTRGWSATFGTRPTAVWSLPQPLILKSRPGFGVRGNAFGFIISWATTNQPVVVEVCTDLTTSAWSPLATNTLAGGRVYFSDPQWTNQTSRIYRVRAH